MENPKSYASPWSDYELLDAGGGKKLERFGHVITIRPDLQAYFKSEWSFQTWNELAHWEFVEKTNTKGVWKKIKENAPESWTIFIDNVTVNLEITKFKHIGIFPEQAFNWSYIQSHLQPHQKFLNLFAYTGVASVVAAQTGAEVIHVDSVKQLVTWANKNRESSNVAPIKWVVEDALKFAQREVKRGNKYDGILMDPPAFGLGAKGEKWILEDKLPLLLEAASELLKPTGFLILNTYSPKLTLGVLKRVATNYFDPKKCEITELWMYSKTGKSLFYGNLIRVSK